MDKPNPYFQIQFHINPPKCAATEKKNQKQENNVLFGGRIVYSDS